MGIAQQNTLGRRNSPRLNSYNLAREYSALGTTVISSGYLLDAVGVACQISESAAATRSHRANKRQRCTTCQVAEQGSTNGQLQALLLSADPDEEGDA